MSQGTTNNIDINKTPLRKLKNMRKDARKKRKNPQHKQKLKELNTLVKLKQKIVHAEIIQKMLERFKKILNK